MLAIVIPYYKKTFFRKTMESIASQTCKDYILYIGDDASPENPQDVIDEYKDKIKIVYRRFDENLGRTDLVAHWERCINLTNGEDWIWVFSDDDTMDSTCVEEFKKILENNDGVKLLRYRKETVSPKGSYMTSYSVGKSCFEDFLKDCLFLTKDNPTMPEFIFSRLLYEKFGFVNFPLAWGSDRITYLKYAMATGYIYNLESVVHFRMSGQNISSDIDSERIIIKNQARMMSVPVINDIFKEIPEWYPEVNLKEMSDGYIDRLSFLFKTLPLKDRLVAFRVLWSMSMSIRSKKTLLKLIWGK